MLILLWEYVYIHADMFAFILPRTRVTGGFFGGLFFFWAWWVEEGCEKGKAHSEIKVISGACTVGKLAEYYIEADSEIFYSFPRQESIERSIKCIFFHWLR